MGTSPHGESGATAREASSTSLRNNLESIAVAILLVLFVRQIVAEAFKIPTGSMAPVLLGVHKEVRCPNCGWVFRVGSDKVGPVGQVQCPNCGYKINDVSSSSVNFRRPAWLWNSGRDSITGEKVEGLEAANRVNRWGSRIFVNKFIYRLREPRRWEVVVFRYPFYDALCKECRWRGKVATDAPLRCPKCGSEDLQLKAKNYIKRVVGLPGETISLRGGDVFIKTGKQADFKIARKPERIQNRLWIPVFDSSYVPLEPQRRTWTTEGSDKIWERDKKTGALEVDARAVSGPAMVRLARTIWDGYAYNGGGIDYAGVLMNHDSNKVGDCRLEATFEVKETSSENACIEMQIVEANHNFRLFVPVEGGDVRLTDNDANVGSVVVRALKKNKKTVAVLENYDDRVVAKIGENVIIRHEYNGNADGSLERQGIALGARGAKVIFRRIRIGRDIYYRREGPAVALDNTSYFMLGDNSPHSSDSREWGPVPEENLLGEAIGVFWPIHDISLLSWGSQHSKGRRAQ